MQSVAVATTLPTIAPRDQSAPVKVTGKVRTAIEAMVWGALPREQAAEAAGLKDNGLYKALRKPAVRAFYLSELDVLRTSERARNIHTLAEVRDQKTNQMARVQAVKALEQLADDPVTGRAAHQVAGFVIQVITNAAPGSAHMGHVRSPEAKPLITLDGGSEHGPEHGK